MLEFCGKHRTLPLNVDLHEGIYRRDVKALLKATKQNLNHMQNAYILIASWAMQIEVEFIRIRMKYHEDGRFWSHGLTSWPKIFEMFFDNLPKIGECKHRLGNTSQVWLGICHCCVKKKGNFYGPHFNPSHKMGNFALFVTPHLD